MTFQHVMQHVLAGLKWISCFAFLDDVLIVSETFEEHLTHLRDVLQRLRAASLRLKPWTFYIPALVMGSS